MCGITGFVDFSKRSEREVLRSMSKVLYHRGPDDFGDELFETPLAKIGFGFRRLSILDLSPLGHQPMHNPFDDNWIVFNGEIYNFQEIKEDLKALGHSFKSSGDTEVILHAYQQWGKECVHRFIGMFAIVIFDKNENKLVAFRDRVGVKPFFYYWQNDLFMFASELKSFHENPYFKKSINKNALASFFQHGYIPAPETIFENCFKLKPGHWLELNLTNREIKTVCYWSLNDFAEKEKLSIDYNEAIEETEKLLSSAFNYRLISDVPVGVFLSGGYDSSCVAAILQREKSSQIKTYTIGFDEVGYNEALYAKEVANIIGTEHHEYYCTFQEAKDIIPNLANVYDEPFGDSSAIPTILVSKIARKHVAVALSADGGDELFAGYPRHKKSVNYINKLNLIPDSFRKVLGPFVKNSNQNLSKPDRLDKLKKVLTGSDVENMFDIINQTFTTKEISKLLLGDFHISPSAFQLSKLTHKSELVSKILALEYITYLPEDILQKVDRATMSVSLEGREPFLDHRIAEFVFQLPGEFKIKGDSQKIILKDIVHKYIPKSIMERPKMGFGVPVNKWCRTDLLDLFMEHMSDEALKLSGLLNVEEIIPLRERYLNGQLENFERIWFIFVFQLWFKKWM